MTVTAHPALVLNADFQPMSYFPLMLMSWQDAVHAVFSERVAVVAEYDKWARSPSTQIRLPSVVALRKYQPSARRVAFTRFNVRVQTTPDRPRSLIDYQGCSTLSCASIPA
jgi:5-methylcytosine-specific restriction endonuclease McrA